MLTVTRAASEYLRELLEQAQAPTQAAVRILVKPDGLKTTIDEVRSGDASFDHEGRKVLVLDEKASDVLSERTLDLEPNPKRLVCLG